ncbi:MAG: response regulator [Gammaproteobacteria bacterium]|nr:response regulator [Gammaproteobacteria bacterium]
MSGKLDPIIYVIDPDTYFRDELLRLLNRSGFRAEGYTSTEDFFSADPELMGTGCIVAEMNLPGASGLELLEMLRARHSDFPMIILTGNPDVSNAVKALQNKAADYLLKPMVERELIGRIRTAVRSSAASA